MSAGRATASKKRKVGVRNSTGSEVYAISTIGINIEIIRCSRCRRIPDKEIFICVPEPPLTYQHSICDVCNHLNNICPAESCCRALVRNTIAEKLLDNIGFKCPWTEFGCNEENITRIQLTSHQNDCEMNPNFLNCLHLFGIKCDYQFFTVFDNDEDKVREMKEHILSHNADLVATGTTYGKHNEENFQIGGINNGIYVTRVLDWHTVDSIKPLGKLLGTSMAIWLVDTDANKIQTVSPYFVSLAENHLGKTKTEVQLTIKSQPKLECDNPRKYLPNLKWNAMNLSTREFKEILMISPQERSVKNYSIPIVHLQNYFVNPNGEVPLQIFPTWVLFKTEDGK